MLTVLSTAPIDGTARYVSKCSWLFHMKVPTRSPSPIPSFDSADASLSARAATSGYDARRTSPSPLSVTTSLSVPKRRTRSSTCPIVSGKSFCINPSSTMNSSSELPGVSVGEKPRRFVPRFHWELLACGVDGHELVGLDARHVRPEDSPVLREIDGVRWYRCLRCDSWLPIPG